MKTFNKERYLRRLKLKRYFQNNSKYIYIVMSCILCGILGLYLAYSKFFVSKEQVVIRTTVGNFIRGDVVVNNYINGELVDNAPAKATGYKADKITCDNDAISVWDNKDWGFTVYNLTKRSKCNVYFVENETVKIGNTMQTLDEYNRCPSINEDGTSTVTEAEADYGYLCSSKDTYGTSYYYRGNVTNNYVYFSGFYWRIIRINGDGTVRVIYDGTSAHENNESSNDRQIGISAFNEEYDDNAYVGYMYGTPGSSTYAATHANTNNSTIKTFVDNWYEKNLKNTTSEKYISDNIFCNDRSFSSYNTGTGADINMTHYRWYDWVDVTLKCSQKNDAFTVSDTSNGNGALKYAIGLITTDEVVLAGGWMSSNLSYYLYTGNWYWTMSPVIFHGGSAIERVVYSDGCASSSNYVDFNVGVRPVLNLKSDILMQGSGTVSDPFHLAS